MLTGAQGETINDKILDRIAEPLEITSELLVNGGQFMLRADPKNYRRI